MKRRINIGIADDHSLVRDGFVSILNSYPKFQIQFEVSNGVKLIEILRIKKPDIVLLDIAMPELDGIAVLPIIRSVYPEIKIIVISAHAEPKSIIEYVRMGARSFLPKDCGKATLIKAINSVNEIGTFYEESVYELLSQSGLFPKKLIKERKLTERELAILKLICQKKSLKEISTILNMNLKTVSSYRHTLFKKTNTQDENELISYAISHKYFGD